MAFVLDASIASRWLLVSQQTAESAFVMARAMSEEVYVPAIFPFELSAVLMRESNLGTVSRADMERFLSLLEDFGLRTERPAVSLRALLEDATRYRLKPADATYVRLAADRGLPLATADSKMREAALTAGVSLLLPPNP